MFKSIKTLANNAVLAYTAVIAVQGLVGFTSDAIDYVQEKIQKKK